MRGPVVACLAALTIVASGCGSNASDNASAPTTTTARSIYSTPPLPTPVAHHKRLDHRHGLGPIELAFKTLTAYGLDPDKNAKCWYEHLDKRPQSHWRCSISGRRYTIHITPAGNPVNYVTGGWDFGANVRSSPYKLVGRQPTPTTPVAIPTIPTTPRSGGKAYCYGPFTIDAVTIPATRIPATTIPATTIPATTFGGVTYPAQTYPAQTYPAQSYSAQTYPAQTIPRSCITVDPSLVAATTVRISGYAAVDPAYDSDATSAYWSDVGGAATLPDFSAPGFGELNGAGFLKNQYVRPYLRRDGTLVGGYWRNSPSDGLPTCKIISC